MTSLIKALLFILRPSTRQGGHLVHQTPDEVPHLGGYAILAVRPGN
jgi:hypothetical protein